jgi:ApaG protein
VDQSSKEEGRYVWSYDITITNLGDEIIQLLNRYWKITDQNAKVEEIRAPGVIGLQPIIKPNKSFAYSSFCQLPTPEGKMEGQYEFQTLEEEFFIIDIPTIILAAPVSNIHPLRSRVH